MSLKALWRYHVVSDPALRAVVGDNVYPQHVSSVAGALYPAISLQIFGMVLRQGAWRGSIQMDSWAYRDAEADRIQILLVKLFDPHFISALPAGCGSKILDIQPQPIADGPFEADTKLYHKYSRWYIVWTGEEDDE